MKTWPELDMHDDTGPDERRRRLALAVVNDSAAWLEKLMRAADGRDAEELLELSNVFERALAELGLWQVSRVVLEMTPHAKAGDFDRAKFVLMNIEKRLAGVEAVLEALYGIEKDKKRSRTPEGSSADERRES